MEWSPSGTFWAAKKRVELGRAEWNVFGCCDVRNAMGQGDHNDNIVAENGERYALRGTFYVREIITPNRF